MQWMWPMKEMFTPGMYIESEILTTSDTLLALPEDAVVEIEDKNYVLLQTSQDDDSMNFERHQVSIGKSTKGFVEIYNHADFGIEAKFLSKGAFNLINN